MGLSSQSSQKIGEGFERDVKLSLDAYGKAGIAFMDFMPVPSRRVFMYGRASLVPTGSAPFDIYGYMTRMLQRSAGKLSDGYLSVTVAVAIGIECKKTSEVKPSIRIVPGDVDGAGIEEHQLEALMNLAKSGGIARVLWNNGGEVGMLTEPGILSAWTIFQSGMATERRGKAKAPVGAKSIRWENFKPVNTAGVGGVQGVLDFLESDRGNK